MRELQIFDRIYKYEYVSVIDADIQIAKTICEKIKEPQILSYCGMETVNLDLPWKYGNFMGSDLIWWIFNTKKEEKKIDTIRSCHAVVKMG